MSELMLKKARNLLAPGLELFYIKEDETLLPKQTFWILSASLYYWAVK